MPEVRSQPQQGPQVGVELQPQPQAVALGLKLSSKRFMKRNPLVFEGTVYPAVAKEWVSMMEKIFEFVQIKDVEKVNCAIYMLGMIRGYGGMR